MNRQQKERLAQFQGITGADAGVASRCLEAAGWSMEAAIGEAVVVRRWW